MKHPKNQHYVPRLYLRQFSPDRRAKNPQICLFDKTNQRVHRASIRNVAAELHFYEREDRGVEKAFTHIEDLFVTPYRRLLEITDLRDLTEDDIVGIVVFVAAQLIRTREHRQTLKSMSIELEKALSARGLAADPRLTDVSAETLRQIHLRGFPDLLDHASAIMLRMKWILCVNQTDLVEWTSDSPVVLYNPRPAPAFQGNDINHAWFQNDLQVRHSTGFVYSNNGDFAFARKILAAFPFYANPERQRMEAI